ncbi:MAG: glutamate--cysteine ligase [Candidatus Tectimicrobiota bacterium]|nr:MAG: glutamate--cysteine ligase [Candidatus Tectomicrobia bacterium]
MTAPLSLFAGFGLELEYMVVDATTLEVLPVVDDLLRAVAGTYTNEVALDDIGWSNELVLHVIELKTNDPVPALEGLPERFQAHVRRLNALLAPRGGCLLPTGMHPWMDPRRQTRLWPHDGREIYAAFHRLFDCRRHGWANLQSVQLNLPFADDAEFARLHAAVRLLLPLLPALAASSPLVRGRLRGWLDMRLYFYSRNAARLPLVTGQVIPEPVYSRQAYEQEILQPLYRAVAPYDPAGLLQHEWLNARGAIARFDRSAIEIRVLDAQECPLADLTLCHAAVAVLRALVAERWLPLAAQQAWPTAPLHALLQATMRHGEQARICDLEYLRAFGLPHPCTAGQLWQHLCTTLGLLAEDSPWAPPLRTLLAHGPLARRLRRALGAAPSRERIRAVYRQLAACLHEGRLFIPPA